jgi:hypothetical protein
VGSAAEWAAGSAGAVQAAAGRRRFGIENQERKWKMKNSGKIWVVLVGVLVFLLFLGFGIFRWYIGGYNRAVNLEQGAEKAWADIDAALQRRLDLVPNLVETVKGYAGHEKELFENCQIEGEIFSGRQQSG